MEIAVLAAVVVEQVDSGSMSAEEGPFEAVEIEVVEEDMVVLEVMADPTHPFS